MPDLTTCRTKLNRLLERHRMAKETVKRELSESERVSGIMEATEEARGIAQTIAQAVQTKVHRRIAGVVTRCLNAVFDDPYEFRIDFDRKRGKTEARMIFIRGGVELDDPLNEVGGGVVDVASLALRLACVLMAVPRARRMLVLDEPFSNIRGEENRQRTRDMLVRLSKDLGVQIILSTDIPAYRLGTVLEIGGE